MGAPKSAREAARDAGFVVRAAARRAGAGRRSAFGRGFVVFFTVFREVGIPA
jgi:hypothetical protein